MGQGEVKNSARSVNRREFLGAAGSGLIAAAVAGGVAWVSPREAKAAGAAFNQLTPAQVAAVEALGEVMVPGAAEAGLAHFLDHHLGVEASESLLVIRYMDIPPPYKPYYVLGLAGLDAAARAAHGKDFADLTPDRATALAAAMAKANPDGWSGPPAPQFRFILRADAVDVVYGTEQGFENLGIPYMAHISPPTRW